MGRPKHGETGYIDIDLTQLEKLCTINCTKREVEAYFKCSRETIERRIKEHYDMDWTTFYEKYATDGKVSLRRKQLETALSGNPTMLIWLGKQYLNQKDKQELEQVSEIKITIDSDDAAL